MTLCPRVRRLLLTGSPLRSSHQGVLGYVGDAATVASFGAFIVGAASATLPAGVEWAALGVASVVSAATPGVLVYYRADRGLTMVCASLQPVAPAAATWHHVTITLNQTEGGALYINGNPVPTTCSNHSVAEITTALSLPVGRVALVGAVAYAAGGLVLPLSGQVADIRLWTSTLTPSYVRDIYEASVYLTDPAPLAWFPCSVATSDVTARVCHADGPQHSMSWFGTAFIDKRGPY